MADQTEKKLLLISTISTAQTVEEVAHKAKLSIQSASRSDQFEFSQNVIPNLLPIQYPIHNNQFQFSQNVTSDPPSLRTPFINNDMRTPTIVTEWPVPDAWSTDEITASIWMQ
ncbi:unnamed protein product [Adineta steineri]|uniref:Uncharacterized protein n=1 Tax=Adineta steineri TaxID=433720 RepID=A0A815AMY0_9BILA|nr:unnamed protein product [Adineta steineri]CAF1497100.1 unnamed protein product [Adineta steineri]